MTFAIFMILFYFSFVLEFIIVIYRAVFLFWYLACIDLSEEWIHTVVDVVWLTWSLHTAVRMKMALQNIVLSWSIIPFLTECYSLFDAAIDGDLSAILILDNNWAHYVIILYQVSGVDGAIVEALYYITPNIWRIWNLSQDNSNPRGI